MQAAPFLASQLDTVSPDPAAMCAAAPAYLQAPPCLMVRVRMSWRYDQASEPASSHQDGFMRLHPSPGEMLAVHCTGAAEPWGLASLKPWSPCLQHAVQPDDGLPHAASMPAPAFEPGQGFPPALKAAMPSSHCTRAGSEPPALCPGIARGPNTAATTCMFRLRGRCLSTRWAWSEVRTGQERGERRSSWCGLPASTPSQHIGNANVTALHGVHARALAMHVMILQPTPKQGCPLDAI